MKQVLADYLWQQLLESDCDGGTDKDGNIKVTILTSDRKEWPDLKKVKTVTIRREPDGSIREVTRTLVG